MQREWKQRHKYRSIEEAILGLSGQSAEDLLTPPECPASHIAGMTKAVGFIKRAIEVNKPIVIVGDYDADGMTSTAILLNLFRTFHITPTVFIPHRFTEGYGINRRIVDELPMQSLVITVDNGITAADPIAYAKSKGHHVIVLDHHLPGEMIPEADVLIDPHVKPEANGFVDYCGAGLALKLSGLLYAEEGLKQTCNITRDAQLEIWREMVVLAGIGTVADCMDLVGDNRAIVMKALKYLNNRNITLSSGLKYIVELVTANQEGPIDHDTIAFKIAPLLNATSRLHDKGSLSVVKALVCRSDLEANKYGAKLQEYNEKRKEMTKEWIERIQEKIEKNPSLISPPIIIYEENLHEGLCGIIAGKLVELYNMPAIVFTKSSFSEEIKGSARSVNGFQIKDMLDSMPEVFTHYGGHAGAAGLAVLNLYKLVEFKAKAKAYMKDMTFDNSVSYDITLDQYDIIPAHQVLRKFSLFGKGVPKPVIRIDAFKPKHGQNNTYFRFMGSNNDHFRMSGEGYNIVAFNRGHDYQEMNTPEIISVIGTIESNTYQGRVTPQVNVIDFHAD